MCPYPPTTQLVSLRKHFQLWNYMVSNSHKGWPPSEQFTPGLTSLNSHSPVGSVWLGFRYPSEGTFITVGPPSLSGQHLLISTHFMKSEFGWIQSRCALFFSFLAHNTILVKNFYGCSFSKRTEHLPILSITCAQHVAQWTLPRGMEWRE